MVVIVFVLSGCTAQMNSSAEPQQVSSQAESVIPEEPSEEETQNAEAADASEETTWAVEIQSIEDNESTNETTSVEEASTKEKQVSETENTESEDTMRLLIGETEVPVTWEENASVEALKALSPITIQMSMYGGFEQVGPIGQSIVRNDVQTDTSYGDIVLYSGNQIVIFYGSNSWAYTRLGHVDLSQQEMRDLLGSGDVSITLE